MSDRTPQEREAARLERERRRASRRGEAPAAPPEPPEPEPVAPPEPESAAVAPPVAEPVAPPEPEPEPEPEPITEPEATPEPPPLPRPMRSFPSPQRALAEDDPDRPAGTVRASPQPGAPGMPQRPVTVPRRRRRRPGGVIALVIGIVLAVLVLGWFALSIFTPFKGDGGTPVTVTIPQGASTGDIGSLLADKGVVGSGFFFALRARLSGDRGKLRAGSFRLRRDMSNGAALDVLTAAPPATPPVVRLVIPEGPGRREVAPLVTKAGIRGNYLRASRSNPGLRPRTYGAPAGRSLEGFLFPATYELRRANATARTLVGEQVQAFEDNTANVSWSYARSKNLSRYDVLIIASMIERETAVARERRLIAGVIYNRLKRGIPLGIDATTRYAEDNWTKPLTNAELQRDSPYNTRRNQGLPPTPIGNPGLASIRAAANPRRTGYLFYVVKPCANGAHAFSKTDAQFQKDVAAYNAKRAALGGRDPSSCPK